MLQLVIVTGFLGAGKTTLLSRALQSGALGRAALLVNEFGATDIDGALLAGAGAAELRRLPNGCVCCAVQGEFTGALRQLADRVRAGELALDRIILETSGLADPAPLVRQLLADRQARSDISAIRVVTVVDAARWREVMEKHVESVRQVACADVVLIAKADLAGLGAMRGLKSMLASLNATAPWHEARHGSTDRGTWPAILDAADASEARCGVHQERSPERGHTTGERHHHSIAEAGIESFVLHAGAIASRDALQAWSSFLVLRYAEQLLRVKGFIAVAGEAHHVLVQGAMDGIAFRPWPGEAPCAGTQVVVIARGMDNAARRAGLRGALADFAANACVIP